MAESNYSVLMQKFGNFKTFLKENSKSEKVLLFDQYTDAQFLQYASVLLHFHESGKLKEIVDKTVEELKIDVTHTDKVNRYYLCFVDYLNLMKKDNHPAVPVVKTPTEEELKQLKDKIEEFKKQSNQ